MGRLCEALAVAGHFCPHRTPGPTSLREVVADSISTLFRARSHLCKVSRKPCKVDPGLASFVLPDRDKAHGVAARMPCRILLGATRYQSLNLRVKFVESA